jgi:hypothetical protein
MGYYREKDDIRYPVFVDDKIGIGDVGTIKEMNYKMRTLETKRNTNITQNPEKQNG